MSKPRLLTLLGNRAATFAPLSPIAESKKFEPGESAVASCVLLSRK